MPSVRAKITTRLFSVGLDEWTHRWRLILLSPVFWIVGTTIGFVAGVHAVPSVVPDAAVVALFGVGALVLGGAVLAAVD